MAISSPQYNSFPEAYWLLRKGATLNFGYGHSRRALEMWKAFEEFLRLMPRILYPNLGIHNRSYVEFDLFIMHKSISVI